MRNRLFFIFLSLFSLLCYCNGQSEKLTIHIQSPRSEFILGEPVQFTLIWENTSESPIRIAKGVRLHHSLLQILTEGQVRKECEGLVTLVEEKVGYSSVIQPHGKVVIPLTLRDLGIVDEGAYTMTAKFDSTKLEPWWDNFNVDRISVVSNTVKFRLVKPTGIDMEIFPKYFDKCNRILLSNEELLHKSSTSTYSGYALIDGEDGQCIPDPRVFMTNILCDEETAQRWPQTANQMAAQKKKALEDSQKRIDQLNAYLKSRPDFVKADALKVEIAGRLAALGRYQEAQTVCEEISSHDANSVEAKKATMLMEFLVMKGYLKEARPSSIPVTSSEQKATESEK